MNPREKEKFLEQQKKANELLNFMTTQRGIKTEKFFDGVDILKNYSLEQISCALAHYCFRNGPIEDK